MLEPVLEYRYTPAAAGRTRLYIGASIALGVVLTVVLIAGWRTFSTIGLLSTATLWVVAWSILRIQLERLNFTLRVGPAGLDLAAPIVRRSIAWNNITAVRRVAAPRMLASPGWACYIVANTRRGSRMIFLFDSDLQQAEQAFGEIVARSGAPLTGN